MSAIRHTYRHTPAGSRGRYGSVRLILFGPDGEAPYNAVREIQAMNDGEQWKLVEFSTPFPFKDTERYRARRAKNRFTLEMLADYLQEVDTRAFDAACYLPSDRNTAALLE